MNMQEIINQTRNNERERLIRSITKSTHRISTVHNDHFRTTKPSISIKTKHDVIKDYIISSFITLITTKQASMT